MRASGVLLPITSLPSRYGIGCFSKSAYEFVDFLEAAGQKYWQILPLGPTGYGDSPYQSFSTFAGNPYFVDLKTLVQEGLLTEEICQSYDFGDCEQYIDYEKIFKSRFAILRKAFEQFCPNEDYGRFVEAQKAWLEDYTLYMAVKNHFDGISWDQWDEDIRLRTTEGMNKYKEMLKPEMDFYAFIQYEFHKQWHALKSYANQKNVQLIGDIPIYVAFDSADSWANPELFRFDSNGKPEGVAGCPPDGFAPTGQLWGNPLYNWKHHEETGFAWWVQRIKACYELYDVVRVDHFRGFDEYYHIPYGHPTAEHGHWEKGPGIALFEALKEKLGDLNVIAEDLGFLTDSVRELVKATGFPGMKILEFAFDASGKSDYLPYNYDENSIVYTGTHDNNTVVGWFETMSDADRRFALDYLNIPDGDKEAFAWAMIRQAMGSVSKLSVVPIQDYLALGEEARLNEPSTLGKNWKWRLKKDQLNKELAEKIRHLTFVYGRL